MDIPKNPCPGDLNSPEHNASIQHDFYSSLKQKQTLSGNYDTPPNLPPAPQTSPVLPPDESTTSRLSDCFTLELLKACSISFSNNTNSQISIAEDMASSSSLPLESSPKESVMENDSGKNRQRDLECSSPMGLPYSLSYTSLSTYSKSPYSDRTSLLVHRESDVSDVSLTESQTLLSDDDTVDSRKPEGYDKVDTEHPMDCWKVYSPRRPRSSVGEFLNWRRNMRERRKLISSADNIYNPSGKRERDDRNSEFLKTI